MSDSHEPANDAEPAALCLQAGADLTDDPEILALLDFEPVPRGQKVRGEWTPELQRELVARIAEHGSLQQACDDMGKCRSGVNKLRKHKKGGSFDTAIDGAIELARQRLSEVDALVERMEPRVPAAPIDYRRKRPLDSRAETGALPGQILNEHGEWEDEESYYRRAEEAGDSIAMKLTRCRRLYLQEISACPGKRAAFEILTELPVDWKLAKKGEPQPFEPWIKTNQRQPDMILTAESGWSAGELGYGPDKKAAARAAIDEWRAEQGLPAIDWEGESTERSDADAQRRRSSAKRCGASSADGSPGLDPGEPDRRHVGFTPRDEPPVLSRKSGPAGCPTAEPLRAEARGKRSSRKVRFRRVY